VVCPQIAETPPAAFFDPDILNSPEFFPLLSKLDIKEDWIDRWETLSGGEKKRCVIADVLIRKPAVLLLDEPANHIDEATLQLLTGALLSFEGTGIVISHNLAFLNALAKSTVLLIPQAETGNEGGATRVFVYAAPPLTALGAFEQEEEGKRERKALLAAETKKLSRAQKDAVREAAQDKTKRMSKKNLDVHDSDTRNKINLARLSGRDRTGGKKAAALQTAFHKKETALGQIDALGGRKTGAELRGKRSEKPVLFYTTAGTLFISEQFSVVHPELEIKNDAHIMIMGENGSGKTSLLTYIMRTLCAECGIAAMEKSEKDNGTAKSRRVFYLPQELDTRARDNLMARLRGLPEKEKGQLLSVIYRLGSEPRALLASQGISPGEARKLSIAFAMMEGAELIALDEPSNHMDSVSAAALSDAMAEFEGALICITHDRVFAEKSGSICWRVERRGDAGQVRIEHW
jgi:ATPase subunit of ABC transporter with duplicated ATPase domains